MYVTSKEESQILNEVNAGTPMGDFLRRYWWPVGFSADLKDKATYVKIMGEGLVLFRDLKGGVNLIDALCPHRRANLCLGMVGPEGIRCKYHGWLMNGEGDCLDVPGEPKDSTFKHSVKVTAYPIQELGGLIFTYMGPQPAPLLPNYDFLVGDGDCYLTIQGFQDCHWLQCVENGLDPVHPSGISLHQRLVVAGKRIKVCNLKRSKLRKHSGVNDRLGLGFKVVDLRLGA